MAANAIEKIEIVGSSKGLDELVHDLNRVADAQDNVAGATKETATVTERSSRTVAATTRAYERVSQQVDAAYRSEKLYTQGKAALDTAFKQQIIDATVYAQRIDQLSAKFGKLDAANDNLAGGAIHAGSAFDGFRGSLTKTGDYLNTMRGRLLALGAALGGAFAIERGLTAFVSMSDQATKLEGRLGLVTGSTSELTSVQQQLFQVSQQTRSEFASNVELYTRAVPALKQLGATQKETIDFTRLIGQAFALSGASGAEASSAIIQLSQALGSGTLRGDEFNSINEQGARVMQALADSLGITRGQLRGLAESGKLTSEVVFKGLLSQAPKLAAEFANVPRSVGDAMTQLRNDMLMTVDGVNKTTGATGMLVEQIDRLREVVGSADIAGIMAVAVGAVTDFIRDSDRLFRDAKGIAAWADNVGKEVERATYSFSSGATGIYNSWKANVDATAAMVGPWVEAWTGGILQVKSANDGATANMGLSWKGFVSSSIDEIANLAASFKALGGIGSDLAFSGTFDAEYAKIRKQMQENSDAFLGKTEVQLETVIVTSRMAAASRQEELSAIKESTAGLDRMGAASAAAADQAASGAAGAGAAIENGITKPSKDAEKALRDAEAAKRKLFGEADAAVEKFFPMEAAQAEATRLQALIDDTGNGLSNLQRKALELQIGKNFSDALPDVENFTKSATKAKGELDTIGELGRDAFLDIVDAIGNGESAVDSLIGAFAGLGKQLASLGAQKLFDGLFGDAKGLGSSGIGGIASVLGQAANAPAYSSGTAGQTFAAPLGQVTRGKLPDLVTGDGFSASKAASVAKASVPAQMWSFFAGKGLQSHQIAGILGNAKAESAFNPTAVGDGGAALGLFQWNDRSKSLLNSIGGRGNLGDVGGQLDFAWQELQTSENKAYQALLKATNVTEATEAFLSFERPAGYSTGVQNSHNYSGRVANANEAYSQYAGGSVQTPAQTQRTIEKGTATGIQKGLSHFDLGGFDSTSPSAAGSAIFSRNGLTVLGAGAGAFGQGYQSGSPLSGGLSGALGGYQAGGAISGMLGIGAGAGAALGVVGGAALGIIGGILGAREKREAAHREAAAKWEEQRPAYETFKRSLTGEGQGAFREKYSGQWGQLSGFMEAGGSAWRYGKKNSTEEFNSAGTIMFTKAIEEMAEFRNEFEQTLKDVAAGLGANSPFSKGTEAVKSLRTQYQSALDDVEIAFGKADNGFPVGGLSTAWEKQLQDEREAAVKAFKSASIDNALGLLDIAEPMSEAAEALDGFRGIAERMPAVLVEMGVAAEEAAKDVDERFSQVLGKMRSSFEQGIGDEINDLEGKGYLTNVREMIDAFAQTEKDAALLGADTSLLPKLFQLRAQDIVNGAELTGTAFDDLILKFPELSGVVSAFAATATRSAEEIASAARDAASSSFDAASSQLQSLYDGLSSFSKSVKDFLSDMKLGAGSPLSQKDQLSEAERVYRETQAKADGGDSAARDALIGVTQTYLDQVNSYFGSSEARDKIFNEVQASLKATDAKTTSQLDVMRSQARWLEKIGSNTLSTAQALKDYVEAQKALNLNRAWGVEENRNKAIVSDLSAKGINYTGNFGGGLFDSWTKSQLPSTQAIINAIVSKWTAVYMPKGMQMGGVVPGFADGGLIGNGIWNVDSVLARYAGGGHIGLAGGEYVMPADVTRQNLGMLETMRAGRMPEAYAMPAMPRLQAPGNDNSAVVQAIGRLASIMESFVTVVAGSGQGTAKEIASLSVEMRSVGRELKKAAGAPR